MDFIVAEDDQHQRLKLLDDMLSSAQGSAASSGPMLLDKIKPADRVTFALNYMYLTLRNN